MQGLLLLLDSEGQRTSRVFQRLGLRRQRSVHDRPAQGISHPARSASSSQQHCNHGNKHHAAQHGAWASAYPPRLWCGSNLLWLRRRNPWRLCLQGEDSI